MKKSSAQLALGAAFGLVPPKEQLDVDIATHLTITDDGPDRRSYIHIHICNSFIQSLIIS